SSHRPHPPILRWRLLFPRRSRVRLHGRCGRTTRRTESPALVWPFGPASNAEARVSSPSRPPVQSPKIGSKLLLSRMVCPSSSTPFIVVKHVLSPAPSLHGD